MINRCSTPIPIAIGIDRKVHQVDFKGAAHRNIGSKHASSPHDKATSQRNIIITGKILFPTIPFLVPVRCTFQSFLAR